MSSCNKVVIDGCEGLLHRVAKIIWEGMIVSHVRREPVDAVLTGLLSSMAIKDTKPGERHLQTAIALLRKRNFDVSTILNVDWTYFHLHGTEVLYGVSVKGER
jgi:hypothetical protein